MSEPIICSRCGCLITPNNSIVLGGVPINYCQDCVGELESEDDEDGE